MLNTYTNLYNLIYGASILQRMYYEWADRQAKKQAPPSPKKKKVAKRRKKR